MTANTVSNAVVAQQSGPAALVAKYQADFTAVLPSHIKPTTWIRLTQGVLRRDPKLAEVANSNPGSLLAALMECAELGHVPGSDQFALTAFGNEVVGIEQYQGEIERMYRAGAVTAVKCEIVRDHDEFEWSPTRMTVPRHEFNALEDEVARGDLAGVYAYALMQNGATSQVVVMGRSEVMRHKAVAKTKKFWEGPWEPSMWKKTAIHELEKWTPTSSEYLREQLRAVRDVAAEAPSATAIRQDPPPNVNTETGEIVDGEFIDAFPDEPK